MKGYIMGWLFEYGTEYMKVKDYAARVIDQVFNSNQSWGSVKVIDQALVGHRLWVVSERHTTKDNKTMRFIDLFILSKKEQWGYKEIDEYGGPAYWDCPKRMLELAPLIEEFDSNGYSKNWREGVLRHHETIALKNKKKRIFKAQGELQTLRLKLQWVEDNVEFRKIEKRINKLIDYLDSATA